MKIEKPFALEANFFYSKKFVSKSHPGPQK